MNGVIMIVNSRNDLDVIWFHHYDITGLAHGSVWPTQCCCLANPVW
jgi:hypothetical protein